MGVKFEVNGKIDITYRGYTFKSSIQNIVGKFIMIGVPIFEGRYLQFYTGDKIDVSYYTERSVLNFKAKVLGDGNERIPVLVIEKPNKVMRVQRRNHVRVSHIIDIRCAVLLKDEDIMQIKNMKNANDAAIDFFDAYTLDISAGGLRVVTKKRLDTGDKLIILLPVDDETITAYGKVIRVDADEYRRYICGISFEKMDTKSTEKVIRYIFKVLREQSQKASKED